MKKNNLLIYRIALGVFIFGNILNTYFLTTSTLNRYLLTFDRTFIGEINSFIGNFVVLSLVTLVIFILIKNAKNRVLTFAIVSLGLNIGLFALSIFTKYYGTAFTFDSLNLFKNPAAELGLSIAVETFKELISYYRIILFIPALLGFILLVMYDKKEVLIFESTTTNLKRIFSSIILTLVLFFINLTVFSSLSGSWPVNAARSTYAVQNIGVYNYYFIELLGADLKIGNDEQHLSKTTNELIEAYDVYNKNKPSYVNFIDGKTYSNNLSLNQTNGISYIAPELVNNGSLDGMFEGKNIVLVHLESFNYFLTQIPELNSYLPFVTELLNESYVLDNFYNNVGVGTSADAEYSVLTGLNPTGHTTLYWDYSDKPFEVMSLASLFNQKDFFTEVIHADVNLFYNREIVYDNLIKFQNHYSLEDFYLDGYSNDDYDHENPWLSDRALMDVVDLKANQYKNENKNFFLFPMTVMPHTPFLYDPYVGSLKYSEYWNNELSDSTLKYIYYMEYYNEFIKRMFVDPITNESRVLDDTVYIFYGDHGANILSDDLSLMTYNNKEEKISPMEYRKTNSQTLAFIYAPDNNEALPSGLKKGMLKGNQTMIRSQIDLYRSITEMFNLGSDSIPYFGTHILSNEPNYSINNRYFDIFTDTYDEENNTYGFTYFSMLNSNYLYGGSKDNVKEGLINYILEQKKLNELFISENLFKEWYKK